MSLNLGNTTIDSLYLGSTKIVEAYLGSVKVMSSGPIVYNVTCSGSHGTVTASPSSGIPGTVVTLSNTPDTGYSFNSYTVNGATLTGNTFVIGNSDVNVTGNFTGIVRNVTCTATNGTVTASPNSGIIGTTVTLSNTPNSGYRFDSYSISGATFKNANQFDIGTSNVSVVGNFIQSSEELWVDLGSTTYTADSNNKDLYVPLTGMPSSSNKNYYTVKFNISGGSLARSRSIANSNICYLAKNGNSVMHVAGIVVGAFWQNGTKLSNTARFGFSVKSSSGTACTIYSSNFIKGQYTSSSVDNTAISKNSISTGSHAIKFVVDRSTKNVYYYLDNNLICYITYAYANELQYANSLYISYNSSTTSINNIKVAGFDTLSEAQAWS